MDKVLKEEVSRLRLSVSAVLQSYRISNKLPIGLYNIFKIEAFNAIYLIKYLTAFPYQPGYHFKPMTTIEPA
jgi:hypothetical protein